VLRETYLCECSGQFQRIADLSAVDQLDGLVEEGVMDMVADGLQVFEAGDHAIADVVDNVRAVYGMEGGQLGQTAQPVEVDAGLVFNLKRVGSFSSV
jgi:hypothetical protein